MPEGGGWEPAVLLPKGQLGGCTWLHFCKNLYFRAGMAKGMSGELAGCCFEQQALQCTFRSVFPLAAGGIDLTGLQNN